MNLLPFEPPVTLHHLRNWENVDHDPGDLLFRYFGGTFKSWDWCQIGDEAREIWNIMFNDDIEEGSVMGTMFSAVAAHASNSALDSVATMFGVDPADFKSLNSYWLDARPYRMPRPIDPALLTHFMWLESTYIRSVRLWSDMYWSGYPDMPPIASSHVAAHVLPQIQRSFKLTLEPKPESDPMDEIPDIYLVPENIRIGEMILQVTSWRFVPAPDGQEKVSKVAVYVTSNQLNDLIGIAMPYTDVDFLRETRCMACDVRITSLRIQPGDLQARAAFQQESASRVEFTCEVTESA